MTLKEYAKQINELAKNHPDIKVVYASDNEGNDYHEVFYAPTVTGLPEEFKNISSDIVCIVN